MKAKLTCLTAAQKEVLENMQRGFLVARRINEKGWYYTRGRVNFPVLFGYIRPITFNTLLKKKLIKKCAWCNSILYYIVSDDGRSFET